MTVHKITDATFKEETKNGVCVIDFYADWCGPCKVLAPVLEETSKRFEDKVKVCKINVDENPEIAGSFGVRSIPTLIAMKDGNKIDTKLGALRSNELENWFNTLIK
jgi:thioredoxin 1